MSPLSILCIVLGILIILSRGPLIVAPESTIAVYRRLIRTDIRVRLLGLFLGALGAVMVWAASGPDGTLAQAVAVLGWLLLAGTLFLLLAPGIWRGLADSVMQSVSDPTALRAIGGLAVAFGILLVWLGLSAA